MVTFSKVNILDDFKQLHIDILPNVTKKALLECAEIDFFSQEGWYLAGGSALALQIGHRRSIDLDFFTPEKSFDEKKVEETLSTTGQWKTLSISRGTVYGELYGAKISLIAYPFFRVREPFLKIGNLSILRPEDIAVMKIAAISQRGKKRDFFDLYWISLNIQPLEKSIKSVGKQYTVSQNLAHILKSLVYFDDAESDPHPKIFFDATWEEVKDFFRKEIKVIADEVIK